MQLPLLTTAVFLGVLCGLTSTGWWGRVALGAVLLLGIALAGRRRWALAVLVGVCASGALFAAYQLGRLTKRVAALDTLEPGQSLCVTGNVERVESSADVTRLRVRGQVEGRNVTGSFRLTVATASATVPPAPGDLVAACGRWQPPFGFFNPGLRDPYRAGAVFEDAGSVLATTWRRLRAGWGPRRWAVWARDALAAALQRASPERAAFLRATVLGERTAVPEDIEAGFKAAGATHALSVSGLHLAAVAALFFVGLRHALLFIPALAARVPAHVLAAALSAVAVLFYTLITGEAVATWRSAVMACVIFAAYVARRPPGIAASIAVAVLAIGAHSVFWIWDVSFQLSVASVVALAAFAGPLGPPRTLQRRSLLRVIAAWLWRGVAATAAAGLVTGPLVAYHFGEVTPAAPLGNLVLTPLVELAVVPLGLIGAAVGAVDARLGAAPLFAAEQAARLTIAVARGFSEFAPIWRLNRPSGLQTAMASAAALTLLCIPAAPANSDKRRRMFVLTLALLVGLGALTCLARWWRGHDDAFRVTFLDVGQGDAAVIRGPHGYVAVIDGGGLGTGFDTGARIVGPFLEREGASHIDLLVLSHPHPDHAQGLFHLLQTFDVGALWMPMHEDGPAHDGTLTTQLRALARERGTRVETPRAFEWHGMIVRPLSPWSGNRIAAPEGLSVNDASLSVHIAYAGRSVFFAGDLEAPGEMELAERAAWPDGSPAADILKAPHHGSRTSSTDDLLRVVAPQFVVVSAGRGNRFGFPHQEVLQRYGRHGLRVLRTDQHGAVQFSWTLERAADAAIHCVRGCASTPTMRPR